MNYYQALGDSKGLYCGTICAYTRFDLYLKICDWEKRGFKRIGDIFHDRKRGRK